MERVVQAPPGIQWASDIILGKRDYPTFNKKPAASDEFQKIFEKELARLDAEEKAKERTDTE